MSRGEIQVIGATTFVEYRKYIEKDAALERRFQPVTIAEPSIDETVDVLMGIKSYYESYHLSLIHISIAGIIAMQPECIVLDEPTAMLDPRGREEVLRTIHKLNREKGITIVLITHYMDEAVQAGRVVVMDDGQILLQGTPKEVFSHVEPVSYTHLDVYKRQPWARRNGDLPIWAAGRCARSTTWA